MKVEVITGVPGGGKSRAMRDEMLSTTGLYLLALPRTELIDEFKVDLEKTAEERCVSLIVKPIHSKQNRKGKSVRRLIHDALVQTEDKVHRVLAITHEALLTLDPARLEGVNVRIDENPDGAVLSGEFNGKLGSHLLEHHFTLEPLGDGSVRSVLRPRPGIELITSAAYRDGSAEMAAILKVASNRNFAVTVNVRSWSEAQITGRRVKWWSIWTPMALESAASVHIAGSGVRDSLLAHACAKLHGDDLAIEYVDVAQGALRANPVIRVHYFTEDRGSTAWWVSDEGSRNLVRVSEYLSRIGFTGYWSCNNEVRLLFIHRFGGVACTPRLAGTNSLRHHTACAFIYSNKAQAADCAILDFLDLDRDTITQVRENEDIAQFAMRGAIRDPSYAGAYDIYLYDRHQAEALHDYLVENGVSDAVEIVPVVDAEIMDVKRPRSSRKAEAESWRTSTLTPEARRERNLAAGRLREQMRRETAREKRRAEGTYKAPGRPKKDQIDCDAA